MGQGRGIFRLPYCAFQSQLTPPAIPQIIPDQKLSTPNLPAAKMEPSPIKPAGTGRTLIEIKTDAPKAEASARKPNTCSKCLSLTPEMATGHRACDRKCPNFESSAKRARPKAEPGERKEGAPKEEPPKPEKKPERHVVISSDEEPEEDGEIREPEGPTELPPEVSVPHLPAVILLESVGRVKDPRPSEGKGPLPVDFPRPAFAADPQVLQQMLSTTFAGIQTMKNEMARMREAQAQAERAKELAEKEVEAAVHEERDKEEEETKPKPAEKQRKRNRSREREKDAPRSGRKRRRTASRGPGEDQRADPEEWTKEESERRRKKRAARRRARKEGSANQRMPISPIRGPTTDRKSEGKTGDKLAGLKSPPELTDGARRTARHFAQGAVNDVTKKKSTEIPPGGRRHHIDSAWAAEIVRDAMDEKRAEDSLIGIDPRGKQPEGVSAEESRLKEDELRRQTKEARDMAFKEFVATDTTLDKAKRRKKALLDEAKRLEEEPSPARGGGPEDDTADRPNPLGPSPGVGRPVGAAIGQPPTTSTTTDTAASTSEVPSPLQRFMALMVLENRQHAQNVTDECRRHEQEMERLLVQYGQETARKK
uniref:Uncharacterized protein n=1 Tax=Globodera rostochiensis TaxID=31243 RepID=A0A914I3G0_GLORO